MSSKSITISVIGRPNVGKSTIFNRLMKKSTLALTHDRPGVTRDRHYGIYQSHETYNIILVDTGGFYPKEIDVTGNTDEERKYNSFFNIMASHAKIAIDESDLILFVVDIREGILPFDEEIERYLRSTQKPFWVLVNKYDSHKQDGHEAQFYSLGINEEQLFPISAEHGRGLSALRSRIDEFSAEKIKKELAKDKEFGPNNEVIASMAIIGAPNVGKSTLFNCLVGANRVLVSDIAGTTVDPIDGHFDLDFGSDISKLIKHNKSKIDQESNDIEEQETETETETEIEINTTRSVKIVDTAGIRKSKLVHGFIESQSVYRSLRSITESDLVLLLIDSEKGITHQDRRLCDIALEKGKSLILVLNKYDLLKGKITDNNEKEEWLENMRDKIQWLKFCDLITISAKHNKNIKKLKQAIKHTIFARKTTLSTSVLNRCFKELTNNHNIMIKGTGGQRLKIKYASQVKTDPPTFLLFSNLKKDIPQNYRTYLINGLRNHFRFNNTPVHLIFKND